MQFANESSARTWVGSVGASSYMRGTAYGDNCWHGSSHTTAIAYATAGDRFEVYTTQLGNSGGDVRMYAGYSEFHVRPLGLLGTDVPHAQLTNNYATNVDVGTCSVPSYGGTSKFADNCWRQYVEWNTDQLHHTNGGASRNVNASGLHPFALHNDRIEVGREGWYKVVCNMLFKGCNYRSVTGIRLRHRKAIDNSYTWVGPVGASSYARIDSSHYDASSHTETTLYIGAGDSISLWTTSLGETQCQHTLEGLSELSVAPIFGTY